MIPARVRGRLAAAWIAAIASACAPDEPPRTVSAAAPDSQDIFATVGEFDLIERSGKHLTRADLLGRPWVASFLFTRCTGPCPKVRSTLQALGRRLRATDARLVTFSVDPEFDTPEVLAAYAEAVQADPERWLFVTGDPAAIQRLARESFLSPAERAPAGTPVGEQVSHSTRLVAVDKRGRVRGFYHGESDDQVDLLVARLAFLQREPE